MTHEIKAICLVYTLRNGLSQKGMAGRAVYLYIRDMDSTIRYSMKFK